MLKIFSLLVFLTLSLFANTTYNIFITNFTNDKKDNALEYQSVLEEYLKLNLINKKVSLNKVDEEYIIKIINITSLQEAKDIHNKIKVEFKDSFIQEVQLDTLKETQKKAMELLKEENNEKAYELLTKTYNDGIYDNQTLFLLAKSAKEEDEIEKAIFYYEELLKQNPSAHRVRLDLADLYYKNGQKEKANEQFLIVKAAKIPRKVEANIENYQQKESQKDQKNYQLYASLGYMSDTNVNAGPTVDTITMYDIDFTLSDDAKRNKDDATTLKARASYISEFENFLLSSSINASNIDYDKMDDYDNTSYSISTNPIIFTQKAIFLFPISYNNINLGMSEKYYLKSISFNPTMRKQISSLFSYNLKLNLEKREYESTPTKDGFNYGISYGIEVINNDSKNINFDAHINKNSSEEDIYSYNNIGVTLTYSDLIFENIIFLGSLNFEMNYYDKAEDAFEVKKDEYNLNGSLNFIYDLNFYNSNLTFSYYNQYNSSNIDLYKYKRSLAMLSLSISY